MVEKIEKNPFSEHLFEYRNVEKKKLSLSLLITTIVMFVEIIGFFTTNSIALLSDAGHMFTHSFAIAISLIAIIIAKKPPCHHRTFGLYRAEILAAFINGIFLLLVVILIIWEAIQRLIHPEEVLGFQMLFIALIGLFVNIISIGILHGSHKENMNIRGVFYHMIADAISSVGIIFAAIIILFTGWNLIDPLVSLLISGLILYWAWGILKESSRVLLETAPKGLDCDIVKNDLKKNFSEIKNLNNMHLWAIIPEMIVFSAHISLKEDQDNIDTEKLVTKINKYLASKYNIIESTIQISSDEDLLTC
ncbi:MAG: cation diffusion facilitator family transporter [Candidatus Thermoplasmatota archaeon]|nr:cation diffusion facilitator family transporter [Candidatus Thermoplasmatota archaeon]